MDAIILTPCRFRGDVVVPVKGAEPQRFSWKEVTKKLLPDQNDRAAKINLRFAKTGDFVGFRNKSVRGTVVPTSFVISNVSGDNLGWLYKRHPDFSKTVEQVYRVEHVYWQPNMVKEPAA